MPSTVAIHAIAARLEPRVRQQFLDAIDQLQGDIDVQALADALDAGDLVAADRAVSLETLPEALKPMATTLQHIFHASGQQAADELGAVLSESLSFTMTNPRAVAWAAANSSRLIVQISDATRAGIQSLIASGIESGRTINQTAQAIRSMIGLTERQATAVANYRAELVGDGQASDLLERRVATYAQQLLNQRARIIARTETIRASSAGQLESWRQSAADGLIDPAKTRRRWIATEDDRECPICADLDGETVPFYGSFRTEEGLTLDGPPAHPNCLLGETRVDVGDAIAVSDRAYDGDVVILATASGNRLACTPNHPILTPKGWVAAAFISEGDDIISSGRREWMSPRDEHQRDTTARIDEIADTLRLSPECIALSVEVSAEDFHGDGVGSDVAIIRTDCFLMNDIDATHDEHGCKIALGSVDLQSHRLHGECASFAFSDRDDTSSRGGMALRQSHVLFSARHRGPLNAISVAGATASDTHLQQAILDHATVCAERGRKRLLGFSGDIPALKFFKGNLDARFRSQMSGAHDYANLDQSIANDGGAIDGAQLAGDLLAGLSGGIFRDKVIDVERHSYIGHVYNLETRGGYFVAEGIITHNCRCTVGLVFTR